jgi:hypothetical protein
MTVKMQWMIQRKSSLLSALLLALSSANAFAEGGQNTPGKNFPILKDAYILQAFDSSKKPNEEPITSSLKNSYFYSNCADAERCDSAIPQGATMFRAPSGFGSTPHSEFPRVELRAKKNFVNGDDFTNTQTGSVYIVKNPDTKSIIFAQIHGDKPGGSELLKLRWQNGDIVAGVKPHYGDKEQRTTLLSGVRLKDKIDYKIEAKGTKNEIKVTVEATADGKTSKKTFSYPKESWQGIELYFKAGNYNQDSSSDGSEAVVAYGALDVSYR